MDWLKHFVTLSVLIAGGLLISQRVAAAEDGCQAVSGTLDISGTTSGLKCVGETAPAATCDSESSCEGSCSCRHWFVETEAVWLAPIQSQHFGGVAFIDDQGVTDGFSTRNAGSFTLSPRITWGTQGECWGLLGRYWRLQTGDMDATLPTIYGRDSAVENSFRAETADLEVTRLFSSCDNDGELRVSFGVRYAQLSEAASVTADRFDDLTYYRGSIFAKQSFSGTGLTAGVRGIRPVGCGCFHLFVDGRASILWDGDQVNYVTTRGEYLGAASDSQAFNDAISASPNHLFIGEIQVGGQWNLPLQCVRANAFLRLAMEYQYWGTGISGGAEAISAAGPTDGPLVAAAGTSNGATHVNLLGFSVGTGLTW